MARTNTPPRNLSKDCRPMMEPLESRRLLTATVWAWADAGHGREGALVSAYHDDAGDHSGGFTVYSSRISSGFGQITVPYVVTGTANGPGSTGPRDHTLASGSVVVYLTPYGSGGHINFDALRDNLVEGTETVTITLQPGAGYEIGPRDAGSYFPQYSGPTPAEASFAIDDDPPVVSVTGSGSNAIEPDSVTSPSLGDFTLTRTGGDLTQALKVTLRIASGEGQAKPSGPQQDYFLSANSGALSDTIFGTQVYPIIPAATNGLGLASLTLVVTPKSDHIVEGPETARVTLIARPTNINNPSATSATVTIADREPTLNSLVAQDYYGQSQQVTAPNPGSSTLPPTLYVTGPSSDPSHAKVALVPGLVPDTDEAFSQTRFSVTGSDGSKPVNSRVFSRAGTTFNIDWSAVPIGFNYTVDAGIDANDDGVLQAAEITRTLGVAQVQRAHIEFNVYSAGQSTHTPIQHQPYSIPKTQSADLAVRVFDANGQKVVGVKPVIKIYAGANGATGTAVPISGATQTDTEGFLDFTATSNGTSGLWQIEVSVTVNRETITQAITIRS